VQILSFSHYNLRAPRELLDELRLFYTEVVGLEQGLRPPFPRFGYWLYAGAQDVLHLTEASADEHRLLQTNTSFDHASFNCTGRQAFERKLTRLGMAYSVSHVPQTGQVQLFFKDPAGNGVELNFTGSDA
jgi:catechol 2,3-dioxygenase-like lactoylglutathione lyase family enzyme